MKKQLKHIILQNASHIIIVLSVLLVVGAAIYEFFKEVSA